MLSEKHSPIVFNPEPTPAFIVVKEPKDLKLAFHALNLLILRSQSFGVALRLLT
jgi:hypothetical protein